jgi:dipeptidyl-peptidase-4
VTIGRDHRTAVVRTTTLDALARSGVFTLDTNGGRPRAVGELPSVAEPAPFSVRAEIVRVGPRAYRAAIIRPRAFTAGAGRRYPVIVDVYGGPHHLHVTRDLHRMLARQWLADHGFIVVAIDGRGTPWRDRAWERHIRGDLARTLDDQVDALLELGRRYPELDLGRVGIYGWSFGGWLSALAALKRPDVFHVAVSGAPVVDWRDYDTFYTERYLGLPAENADGYNASSLLSFAGDLRRPLALIHGTSDDNVFFFHTLKLAHALLRAGRPVEILALPGLTHMVPDPTITEALDRHLLERFRVLVK